MCVEQNLSVGVVQVLRVGCPDIITLDLGKITGRGIIVGASFQVPLLAAAPACFGPTPTTQVCTRLSTVL